jgi:hypothetical protein
MRERVNDFFLIFYTLDKPLFVNVYFYSKPLKPLFVNF